jgi:hypothetical protein
MGDQQALDGFVQAPGIVDGGSALRHVQGEGNPCPLEGKQALHASDVDGVGQSGLVAGEEVQEVLHLVDGVDVVAVAVAQLAIHEQRIDTGGDQDPGRLHRDRELPAGLGDRLQDVVPVLVCFVADNWRISCRSVACGWLVRRLGWEPAPLDQGIFHGAFKRAHSSHDIRARRSAAEASHGLSRARTRHTKHREVPMSVYIYF